MMLGEEWSVVANPSSLLSVDDLVVLGGAFLVVVAVGIEEVNRPAKLAVAVLHRSGVQPSLCSPVFRIGSFVREF
jgi:hypothetical protein